MKNKLISIKSNSYYINSSICTGIYVEDKDATVIDTGIDDDSGRRIFNICKENGWDIKQIINTHCHGESW